MTDQPTLYRRYEGDENPLYVPGVFDSEAGALVPVGPVGTIIVNNLNRVMVDDGEAIRPLPPGEYLIVPKEAKP